MRAGRTNWRQESDASNPNSSRAFGVLLLVASAAVGGYFIYQLLPKAEPRLFVDSLVLSGYADPTGGVRHLPPIDAADASARNLVGAAGEGRDNVAILDQPATVRTSEGLERWRSPWVEKESAPGPNDTCLITITGHSLVMPGRDGGFELMLVTSEFDPRQQASKAHVPLVDVLRTCCEARRGTKVVLLDIFRLPPDLWIGLDKKDRDRFLLVREAVEQLGRTDLWVITACGEDQQSYVTELLKTPDGGGPRSLFEAAASWAMTTTYYAGQKKSRRIDLWSLSKEIKNAANRLSSGLQSPQLLHASGGEIDDSAKLEELAQAIKVCSAARGDDPDEDAENEATTQAADASPPSVGGATAGGAPAGGKDAVDDEDAEERQRLGNSPDRIAAAYAPALFRSGNWLGRGAAGGVPLPSDADVERSIPAWENWRPEAQERRAAFETVVLATSYADRYVRLCESTRRYSGRLRGLPQKLARLIGAIAQVCDKPATRLNSIGITEVETAHREVQDYLERVHAECLSRLPGAGGGRVWDFGAELTCRAIEDSRVVSEPDRLQPRRGARLSVADVIGSSSGIGRSRPGGETLSSGLVTRRQVRDLQESLFELGGYDSAASASGDDPFVKWFVTLSPPSPGTKPPERLVDCLAWQLVDPRSRVTRKPSQPNFTLPADIRRGVPIDDFVTCDWDSSSAARLHQTSSDGLRYLTLNPTFFVGGDRLTESAGSCFATVDYDDSRIDVEINDGRHEPQETVKLRQDNAYNIHPRITVRERPGAGALTTPAQVTLRFPSLGEKAFTFSFVSDETPQAAISVERRVARWLPSQKRWRSVWQPLRSVETTGLPLYADLTTRFRLRIETLGGRATSFGVVVTNEEASDGDRLDDLEPIAVGLVEGIAQGDVRTVPFSAIKPRVAPAEGEQPAADPLDSGAATARLLERLLSLQERRRPEAKELEPGDKRWFVYVINADDTESLALRTRLRLRSPRNYLQAAVEEYDGSTQRGKVVLSTPSVEAFELPGEPPKKLVEAKLGLRNKHAEIEAVFDYPPEALSIAKPTDEARTRFGFEPGDLADSIATPRLLLSYGSYPRAETLAVSREGGDTWKPYTKAGLEFARFLDAQEETITLRRGGGERVAVIGLEEDKPPASAFAEFAVDFGGNGLDTPIVEAVRETLDSAGRSAATPVKLSHPLGERRLLTKVGVGDETIDVAAMATDWRLLLDEDFENSFRCRIRVRLGGNNSNRLEAVSPTFIYDRTAPDVRRSNGEFQADLNDNEIEEKTATPLKLSVKCSEAHSGIKALRYYWETDGNRMNDEKVNPVEKPGRAAPAYGANRRPIVVGDANQQECWFDIPVEQLPPSTVPYQLMIRLIDHAGNETTDWRPADRLLVAKKAPKATKKKKSSTTAKKEAPPTPVWLLVEVRYPSGKRIADRDAGDVDFKAVDASGGAVSMRYSGRSRWESTSQVKPGSYAITVKANVVANRGVGKGTATAKERAQVGATINLERPKPPKKEKAAQ